MTHSPETIAKAEELYLKKVFNREIARQLNLAPSTVNTWGNNLEEFGRFGPVNFKGENHDIDEHGDFIFDLLDGKYDIELEVIRDSLLWQCGFKCCVNTVRDFLDRKGVPRPEERRRICRERNAAETATEATDDAVGEYQPECTEDEFSALRESFVEFDTRYGEMGDKRSGNAKKYKTSSIAFLAHTAALANYTTIKDIERFAEENFDFLKRFIDLPDTPPNEKTIARILSGVETELYFDSCFDEITDLSAGLPRRLACDGKLLNGTSKKFGDRSVTGVVAAVDQKSGLVERIYPYGQGVGEIPGLKNLLLTLDIDGAWVSADALHLQWKTAEIILDRNGHYMLGVRGNQPTLEDELHLIVRKRGDRHDGQHFVTETGHGREVVKQYRNWNISKRDQDRLGFPGAKMIATCFATYGCKGLKPRYYLLSEQIPVETTAELVGGHWTTERINWEADVVHDEDHHQLHDPKLAVIMAATRRRAMNVVKLSKINDTGRGIHQRARMSNKVLANMIINHKANLLEHFNSIKGEQNV